MVRHFSLIAQNLIADLIDWYSMPRDSARRSIRWSRCRYLGYGCNFVLYGTNRNMRWHNKARYQVYSTQKVVGSQPWDGRSSEEMIDKIFNEGIVIPDWISEECANLIVSMLRVREKDRIKIEEMKRHPWVVQDYNGPPDSYLPDHTPVRSNYSCLCGMLQI